MVTSEISEKFYGSETSNFRLLFMTSGKSVHYPFLYFFSMITIVFCSLSFYCWCCLFFSAPSPLACVWRSSLASRFPSLLGKNAKNNPCYAGHVLSWKRNWSSVCPTLPSLVMSRNLAWHFANDVVYCRFQTKMASCLHQALDFYDLTGKSETTSDMKHCTKPKEEF